MQTLFDLSSFIIQAINFIIVALVLRSFFFKPYMKFLEEETAKRHDLEKKIKQSESLLSDAQIDAEKILDESKVNAKIISNEIVESARREAAEIRQQASLDADAARSKGFAQVEFERKQMKEELKGKILDIAMKLNARLFENNEANTSFLKKHASTIEFK